MFDTQPGDGGSILVVDEEAGVRELLVRWLTAAGFNCLQAASSFEAWNLLQRKPVTVATVDTAIRGESGNRLVARIVEQYPHVSVLMLTQENSTSAVIQSLTAGACGYLIKPIRRDALCRQVCAALDAPSQADGASQLCQSPGAVRRGTDDCGAQCSGRSHSSAGNGLQVSRQRNRRHVSRTGLLSETLARAFGWSVADAERLRLAAPMHDIGKIGIPDSILHKPGRLTPAEFEIMKQHTSIGAEILSGSDSAVLELARTVALSHHERWDGRGYPLGLRGTEIPVAARILAIVDVYDALTHDRVYRPALTESHALGKMCAKSGTHFDADLLELFFEELPTLRRIADANPDHPISSPLTLSGARILTESESPSDRDDQFLIQVGCPTSSPSSRPPALCPARDRPRAELLVCRMRQVGIATLVVGKRHEETVRKPLGSFLGAQVGAPFKVLDHVDLSLQGPKRVDHFLDLRFRCAVFEFEQHDVAKHGRRGVLGGLCGHRQNSCDNGRQQSG